MGSSNLIRKVYFPRLVVPLGSVLSGAVDFGLAFLVLLGMMVYYRVQPTAAILALPFFFLLAFVTAVGAGLWLSALNVQFRDIRHVVPFLAQLWLFATPIAYPSSLLEGHWQVVYGLNPMVGVVEGFRWSLLGSGQAPGPVVLASSVASLLLLISGAYTFRRMERTFADVV